MKRHTHGFTLIEVLIALLVLGIGLLGVAGLQAIATSRRLGAQVQAYDIRAAAREQVESLGARLIDTGVDATSEGGYARELTDEEKVDDGELTEMVFPGLLAFVDALLLAGAGDDGEDVSAHPDVVRDFLVWLAARLHGPPAPRSRGSLLLDPPTSNEATP